MYDRVDIKAIFEWAMGRVLFFPLGAEAYLALYMWAEGSRPFTAVLKR